jgi:hypothetical protein
VVLLDGDGDCVITADEIIKSPETQSLLSADVCSTESCSTADAVSLGVQVDAVKATFPM